MEDHGTEFLDDQLPEPATSALEWERKAPCEDNGAFEAKVYFTSLAQSTRKTARCLEDRRKRDGRVDLIFTEETIAIATLMLSSVLEDKWSPGLAAFTKHAKSRKTVNDDDVRLLFNGNTALMRVINARADALPDCSVGTKRPAAQNGAGGGGKRGKTKKDAAGRLSAMGRSKSPTPFDEDSNSTLHAQPQPWQPAATKKDVDAHSTKGPVKGGAVPKKTTKRDDITRPTGFAHLTTELQAKKHRTGMNWPKHSNRGSVYKPAPGSNKKWNTIDRFVSKDCSNGSKTPLTSSVAAPALRSIPEKSTSSAFRRNLTEGPGANIIAIEVDDDFYNDEVMVIDPLDQALDGAGKQNAVADSAVAEDDDEVLLRALGEATPSRAPGSHKDNTVKGFTFLSDDEEQSAGAAGNPVSVANEVTNATAGKDSFDDDIQWECSTQDMPKAKLLEEVNITKAKKADLQSSTTSFARKPFQTRVSESIAASTIRQGNRPNSANDSLTENSVTPTAPCVPEPLNVTSATKGRFSAFSFDDDDDLGACAAIATTSAAPHMPAQMSTPILPKVMSAREPNKATSAAKIAGASTVRNLPVHGAPGTLAKRKPTDNRADDDKKLTERSGSTMRRSALLRQIPLDDFDDFYDDDI